MAKLQRRDFAPARLPSGWHAATEFVAQPLICQAEIVWFFQSSE